MVNGTSLEEELNRIDEFFDKLLDEELDSIIDENLFKEDYGATGDGKTDDAPAIVDNIFQ